MRNFKPTKLSLFILSLTLAGCVYPTGPVVTSGHQHSTMATGFLSQPDTTRDDAIANLGEPLWESSQSRVLLYLWTTSMRWVVAVPPGGTEFLATPRRRALLISYNERGSVTDHEICTIGEEPLEQICSKWKLARQKPL